MAMYQIDNPQDKAMGFMGKAADAYGKMTPDIGGDPGPSAGGAINAGMSGAMAGASMAPMLGVSGMTAGGVGLALGVASYLFS